jgi:hypothetical protein
MIYLRRMKRLCCISFLLLVTASLSGQTLVRERCKTAEVELITGDCVPKGYVISGIGTVACTDSLQSLDQLSPKVAKEARRTGRRFKVCQVFVDFQGVYPLTDGQGKDVHEKALFFYALARME